MNKQFIWLQSTLSLTIFLLLVNNNFLNKLIDSSKKKKIWKNQILKIIINCHIKLNIIFSTKINQSH